MEYEIKEIISSSKDYGSVKIISNIYNDRNFKDIRYMTAKIIENPSFVAVMAVIEQDKCQIILSRSKDINIDMKNIFNNVIGIIEGQGGGNPQMTQGGGTNVDNLNKCISTSLSLIKKELESLGSARC